MASLAPAFVADPVPLTRAAVTERLLTLRGQLEADGVGALYLFGSVARDEATAESDIDVFYEITRRPFDLFDMAGVQHTIEDGTGRSVDAKLRQALKQRVRERAEADAVRIFP